MRCVYQLTDLFLPLSLSLEQTTVAILGIIGNALASVILTRKEMRNAFNLLLVTMACFDSTYLFGSILESFRKEFQLGSDVHIVLFPYLLYPFNQVMQLRISAGAGRNSIMPLSPMAAKKAAGTNRIFPQCSDDMRHSRAHPSYDLLQKKEISLPLTHSLIPFQIAITASIFMTVAIALEVCNDRPASISNEIRP